MFNCACTWTILYGLWTDTISTVEYHFFWTKNSIQYLWIRRYLFTNVLFEGQCRAWQSHFLNIIGCCSFTEVKSCEVCTVLLDKELFLKNRITLAIWTITCPSRLLGGSDFGLKVYKVWPPTTDSSYKVTYSKSGNFRCWKIFVVT